MPATRSFPRTFCLLALLTAISHLIPMLHAKDEDMPRTEKTLLKLAKRDDARAQLQLGIGYLTGKHEIEPDSEKAWEWLQKAAEPRLEEGREIRNPRALLYLGICYDEYWEFLDIDHDKRKALDYYLLAIENGLPQGHHYAAFTYRELGNEKNAAEHFKAAADFGNQVCQIEYAKSLLNGIGVERDPKAALPYLEKAALAGSAKAQLLLADCYAGKYPPIETDLQEMIDSLWNAASKSPAAMTRVGYCYEHGYGLNREPVLAVRWYQKAAKAGEPHAMINLGACYAQGTGVRQDPVRALQLYLQATTVKNPPALAFFNVGACYAAGIGTDPRPAKAYRFFQRAADLGSVSALYRMGLAHENGIAANADGEPIPKSPETAVALYRQAAAADHAPATYRLALCYLHGKGVAADRGKGQELLQKAADLGSTDALRALATEASGN